MYAAARVPRERGSLPLRYGIRPPLPQSHGGKLRNGVLGMEEEQELLGGGRGFALMEPPELLGDSLRRMGQTWTHSQRRAPW